MESNKQLKRWLRIQHQVDARRGAVLPEILVIDDNPTHLSVREAVLRGAGFSVLSAHTAEAALKLLRDSKVGSGLRVIVTDHVLPGACGDVFVRELRKLAPSMPVLVVTGMDEAEPQYAGLGVTFLHKPCAPEELIAQVNQALEKCGRKAA